jgi:hypothetical protein
VPLVCAVLLDKDTPAKCHGQMQRWRTLGLNTFGNSWLKCLN